MKRKRSIIFVIDLKRPRGVEETVYEFQDNAQEDGVSKMQSNARGVMPVLGERHLHSVCEFLQLKGISANSWC